MKTNVVAIKNDGNKKIPRARAARAGMPSHIPTDSNRAKVEAGVAFGVAHKDIAYLLNISIATLRRHYRKELDLGCQKACLLVAQNLHRMATSSLGGAESVNAAKFFLERRGGPAWEAKETLQLTGADKGPIEVITKDMTPAQAAEIYARQLRGEDK